MIQRSLVTALLIVLCGATTWAAGYASSERVSPVSEPTVTTIMPGNPVPGRVNPSAGKGDLSRQTIREMPLLERPNRPGHFYGNTVRRVHTIRSGR